MIGSVEDYLGKYYHEENIGPTDQKLLSIMQSVGRIRSPEKWIGTVFFLEWQSFPFLVSAFHCFHLFVEKRQNGYYFDLENLKQREVVMPDGRTFNLDLRNLSCILHHPETDVMLLGIKPQLVSTALRASEAVLSGESLSEKPVVVVGYPGAFLERWGLRGPVVSVGRSRGKGDEEFSTTARVNGGHSGSPVIDEFGCVMGIATGSAYGPRNQSIFSDPDTVSLAVPIDKVLQQVFVTSFQCENQRLDERHKLNK